MIVQMFTVYCTANSHDGDKDLVTAKDDDDDDDDSDKK